MDRKSWLAGVGGVLPALALMACTEGGSQTPVQPPQPVTTPPPPAGTFAITSTSPAFGATLTGRDSDLQGVTGLSVNFQMTYAESIPDMYFVLQLFNGTIECLRSQIAYSVRFDSSPARVYAAGTTAVFRSEFFVRDNQLGGCGQSFTTNRIRFVLQDRSQLDPATGQLRTLFFQDTNAGWSFAFAR